MEIYRGNVRLRSLKLTGQILAADGSAAAPSISFTSDPNSGFVWESSGIFSISMDGTPIFRFNKNVGFAMAAGYALAWKDNADVTAGSVDLQLFRDAANVLAQRNGTAAQRFNIYNTTDGTNLERAHLLWSSNVFYVGTMKSGTGTARAMTFQTDATDRWTIGATTGHLLAAADDSFDIGASGQTRPRNLYLSGSSIVKGLAYAVNETAAAAGGAQAVSISSTAAFGVYWGSGAPTVSAAKGSLYLRTDGSGTTDRAYINTNGGTTWTALTTVA